MKNYGWATAELHQLAGATISPLRLSVVSHKWIYADVQKNFQRHRCVLQIAVGMWFYCYRTTRYGLPCAGFAHHLMDTAERAGYGSFKWWFIFSSFVYTVSHQMPFFCHFVHLSVFILHLSLSVLSLLLHCLSSFIIGEICLAALSIFALQLYQDVFSFLTFSSRWNNR